MANPEAHLNNPIWQSLTSHHASIAQGNDLARRYPHDIAGFGAVAANDDEAFASLAALIPAEEVVVLVGSEPTLADTWTLLYQFSVVQMVYDGAVVEAETNDAITSLSPADVPAMLELVELTHPGPFFQRTIELGRYLGIWQDGQLAAMAGQRFHPPGYHEISAVCTHPSFQKRGYARQLMLQLMHDIQSDGDVPFLHVVSENVGAIALYEKLGFKRRIELPLFVLRRQ